MNITDPPISETARWFVCQTGLKQERLAVENLQRQKFEAYCPMQLQTVTPRGQPARVVATPFFQRYIFVRVDMTVVGWRSIYGTRGVAGVLPSTRVGTDRLARLVEELKAREVQGLLEVAAEAVACPYVAGQPVRLNDLIDGLFVDRVDERRCRVMISLIGGRDSQHIVDLADIESR